MNSALETLLHLMIPAMVVALVVATKRTWRAVAISSEAAGGPAALRRSLAHARMRTASTEARDAVSDSPVRSVALSAAERPVPSVLPDLGESAPRPAAEVITPSGAEVVRAIGARMDEATYVPGDPNVFAMTKLLPAGAAPERAGDEAFRVSRIDERDRTTLHVQGGLDALAAARARPVFDGVVHEGRRTVVVDLSKVDAIDSAGVGLLVSLQKQTQAHGGAVRIVGLAGQPLSVLRLLRLDRFFSLE